MKTMNVSFDFMGKAVRAEVKDLEVNGSIVRGVVTRLRDEHQKGIFFLWDCAKYRTPMLKQYGKPLPGAILREETEFVLAALKAYKAMKAQMKSQVAATKEPESVPDGFEPVECDLFGVDKK